MRTWSFAAPCAVIAGVVLFPLSGTAQSLRSLTQQELSRIRDWSNTYVGYKLIGNHDVSFGHRFSFKNYNNFEIVSLTMQQEVRNGNHLFKTQPFTFSVFENRIVPHRGVLLPFDSCKELPTQWVRRPRRTWTTVSSTEFKIISAQTYAKRDLTDFGCIISFLSTTGNDDILKTLKARPSLLKQRNMYGVTPLHAAFAGSDVGVARYILKNGGNPKERTKGGASIMHFAAANWNPGVVELALSFGFSVNDLSSSGKRVPLEKTILRGIRENFDLFLRKKANLNHINGEGSSLVAISIFEGHEFAFNTLLANGAALTSHEANGDSLLHVAALRNHLFIDKLLKKGINVDVRNPKNGCTPLMYAIDINSYESQANLLRRGANPKLKNKAGEDCYAVARKNSIDQTDREFRIRVEQVKSELRNMRGP